MNTELKKEQNTCLTGRRYGSVSDLLKKEGVSSEIQEEMAKLAKQTELCQMLSVMRLRAGLTQQQMAEKVGVTQSAISKWEAGPDKELTVQTLAVYASLTEERISLLFGKPLNHVEAVKAHAFEIKRHLLGLAAIANQVEEAESAIQGFFGEAFFNILTILAKCQEQLPSGSRDFEIKIKLLDSPAGKKRKESTPIEVVPA
jgi:transcriptional regulator with XRE-family HTH domain